MHSRARMPQKSSKNPKKFSLIPFLIILSVLFIVIIVYWQFKSKNDNLNNYTIAEQNTNNVTFTEQDTMPPVDESPALQEPANDLTVDNNPPGQETIEPANTVEQNNTNYLEFSDRYDNALKLFYAAKYNQAMDIFKELQSQYPDHSFQVNCQHWIGECYFGNEDFSNALSAFQNVLTYGKTYKTDDALLMVGRSYQKMGDKVNARLFFNRLINEYPASEYVDKAQWHLSRL